MVCFFKGNIFVIAAIVLERNLQSVANYLILSLAVADLLVAVLVMPLGAVYEVRLKMICFAALISVLPIHDHEKCCREYSGVSNSHHVLIESIIS